MSPIKYVQEAVGYCKAHFAANIIDIFRNSFMMGHDTELGINPELETDEFLYFQTNLKYQIDLSSENLTL